MKTRATILLPILKATADRKPGTLLWTVALVTFAILACTGVVSGQTVPLGSAQDFTVLGGSTVTNTGLTVITGDVGVSPGTAIVGFPPGTVVLGTLHSNDSMAMAAHADAVTAYNQVSGEAPTMDLTGQDLGGKTLTPGVYHFATSAQLTGVLTLNNLGVTNAPFHFLIGSTLTTAANASVVLLGAMDPNIFWQVGSSATIGANTAFQGNIIALTSITFDNGAGLVGRALAINGAVTLIGNTIDGTNVSGTGTVVVSSGTLGGSGVIGGNVSNSAVLQPGLPGAPGKLDIAGNLTDTPSSTTRIQLASTTNYSKIAVGGVAALGGAVELSYVNGFTPKPGEVFSILTAGGGISGKFAGLSDPDATGTLLTLGLVYQKNDVLLEFEQGSFAALALTANERAVAGALDKLAAAHPNNRLIRDLDTFPLAQIPRELSLLSPEDLASLFTVGLAVSQEQDGNVELRLEEIRNGASGFSDSQFAASDANRTVSHDDKNSDGKDYKNVRDAKDSVVPATVENERRWGFFISGVGEWGDLAGSSSARGSSFATGGVTVGADYRVNNHLVLGATVGYANTSSDLAEDGHIHTNGGESSLYGTYYDQGVFLDGIIGGGYSSYDTMRRTVGGFANGRTDGGDFSGLIGTGYEHQCGPFTLGPIASLRYSEAEINGFTEQGAIGALQIGSRSQDSLVSEMGARATYTKKLGHIVVVPEVDVQWEHEYLASSSSINAGFSSDNAFTVRGPNIGRDGILLDAGVSVQVTPHVALFGYYTGELGRENYTVHSVSGGVRMEF